VTDDAAVTRALLAQKLDGLKCDVEEGFRATASRLDRINGTVQKHSLDISNLTTRTESLEKFRDMAVKALFSGIGAGLGIAVTAGGILFGIGKAVGWW